MADVKIRYSLHQRLVKFNELARAHSTVPLNLHTAQALLQRSEETMKQCQETHIKIVQLCADDESIELQEKQMEPVEDVFLKVKASLCEIIEKLKLSSGASGCTTATSGSTRVNIKLPAIELPTFDGHFANWPSFKDLFLATVGTNPHLAPSQKLQDLKSALQNEPATLLKSITITDQHYHEAWDMLKDRYDNTREKVHSIINKLLNHKSVQTESASELQKLIDNAGECTRQLKVLKQPVDHWDSFLVVIHVNKLDAATRREWAIRQTGTNLPTFQEFVAFVTNHIRGLLASGASGGQDRRSRADKQVKSYHAVAGTKCVICQGTHPHFKCNDFQSKSSKERNNVARRHHLCFNCLSRDHKRQDCPSETNCRTCGRRHHTLLHFEPSKVKFQGAKTQALAADAPRQSSSSSSISSHHTKVNTQVLLYTAVVRVKDNTGGLQLCRIFLDSGSEGTFISEDCVNRLGLKRQWSRMTVTRLFSTEAGTTRGKLNVTLLNHFNQEMSLNVEAHFLPKLTGQIPGRKCKVENWTHILGLELADPKYYEPAAVDMLIGADYVAQLMMAGRKSGPRDSPVAQETIFGWVLSGRINVSEDPPLRTSHLSTNLEHLVKRFWEVEEPPTARVLTREEKLCEQHFLETHQRDQTERYVVSIPFNEKKTELGLSRHLAVKRLHQVERRLQRHPEQKEQYVSFLREYENLGHMVKLPPEISTEVAGATYYLPHHCVVNNSSTTTKLRVVFDGSAPSSSGISLNDTMLVGATVQDDLYSLLLRFLVHPIILKADKHVYMFVMIT